MEKIRTTINIHKSIKNRSKKAIAAGKIAGINDFSGLVELCVDEKLRTAGI